MSKLKRVIGLSILAVLCFTASVFFIFDQNVKPTKAEETVPSVEIIAKNLSLEDYIHFKFAVSATDTMDGDEVGVLTWESVQDNYTYETAKITKVSKETMIKNGVEYPVYKCFEISSKEMTDTVFARSYVRRGESYYYGDVIKYSVLEYAYNKLGKTDATPTSNQDLKELLEAMLNYGGLAQTYFDYKVDTLASDDFVFVKIPGAKFDDGFNYGFVKEGQTVQVKVPDNADLTDFTLVSGATCLEPAIYSYTVDGVTVYVNTPALGHDYAIYENNGDDTHTVICSRDNTHTAIEPCVSSEYMDCIYCGGDYIISNGNSVYGYNALTEEQNGEAMQSLYMDMYLDCTAFANSTENVVAETDGIYLLNKYHCASLGLTVEEAISVWKIFYLENPQFYWLSNTLSYSNGYISFAIDGAYSSYEYRQECDLSISNMLIESEQVLNDNMSDLETALALHDFIIGYMDYAYEEDGVTPVDDIWAHNMIGCAKYNLGVCESYAKTYNYLCLLNGVNTVFVSGVGGDEAHAWNLIEINGEWYGVDLTWNDKPSGIHDNFGLSATILNAGHTADTSEVYGADWLYDLPTVSENNIELVDLYNGETFVGTFENIDVAFTAMTDTNGDYIINLYEYTTIGGPYGAGISALDYTIDSVCTPKVSSIKIEGNYYSTNTSSGMYTSTRIDINSIFSVNCDFIIDYVKLNGEGELNINSNVFTAIEGCGIMLPVYGSVDKDAPSKIIAENTRSRYNIFYNDVNVYEIYGGHYDCDWYGTGLLNVAVASGKTDLYIGVSVQIGELVGSLEASEDVTMHIDKVVGEYSEINLAFSDLDRQPTVVVGNIDASLLVCVDEEIFHSITGIGGNEESTYLSQVSIYDLKKEILTLNINDDFSKIKFFIKRGGVISGWPDTDRTEAMQILADGKVTTKPIQNVDGVIVSGTVLIDVDFNVADVVVPNYITAIGVDAFRCSDIESVKFEENSLCESIGRGAFFNCRELRSVEIPNVVANIGDNAFYYCDKLTGITFGENSELQSIGYKVFAYCTSLTNIEIPSSVTSIGSYAFEFCTSLTNIEIPSSVTSIGSSAFRLCYSLTDITLPFVGATLNGTENTFFGYVFGSTNQNAVPSSLSKVVITGGNRIDDKAFEFCEKLISIELPNSITSIGSSAFSYCSQLTSIVIPNSVTEIGDYLFTNCNNLQYNVEGELQYLGNSENKYLYLMSISSKDIVSATINENCRFIGDKVFQNCVSLQSIEIPSSVTKIGKNALRGCTSLTSLIIPENVTSFGEAFRDCTLLTNIKFNGTTEEWAKIEKGTWWDLNIPAKEVICSDGAVAI